MIAAVSLAGGLLPLVLIGAPFGWPPELSLGEFFTSMYPWPVINELLLILGGLLWAAATLALPPAPPRPLPPLPPIMNAVN